MARIKSPEKRNAILQAAIEEINKVGLSAATAKIARRAGISRPEYLNVAFKREVGMPPGEYRRRNQLSASRSSG